MNLYRLIRTGPYLNFISLPSILQSHIKSSLINKPKIDSKNEDPVSVDPYNLAVLVLRLSNSHKAAGSLYERRIIRAIENLFSRSAEDVGEMKELYMKIHETGIEIPSSSYQILIKSLIKKGDWVTASQICRECVPKPWFSDFFKSSDGCLMINSLLMGLSRYCFSEIEILVETLENQGLQPKVYFYKTMIHQLFFRRRSAEALELFKKQSAKGMKFESDTYKELFERSVRRREKNLDWIKVLYNDAQEKNVEFYEDCYETLVYALSANGDFDAVLSVYEKYKHKKNPMSTLSDLCSHSIHRLCKEDIVDAAKALFEWMVSKGMFPREHHLEDLIERYCERRNYVEELKWTFHKIQEKGLCTDDYCDTDVLELIAKVGDPETASEAKKFLKRDMFVSRHYSPKEIKEKRMILSSFLGVPNVKETVHQPS